jgi:spore germination protein GerM
VINLKVHPSRVAATQGSLARLLRVCVSIFVFAFLLLEVGETLGSDSHTIRLKVYFSKDDPDAKDTACDHVVAVNRQVPRTTAVARAALQELFAGPTREERELGFHSWFSESTRNMLQDIKISRRTAYVSLADIRQLIPGATTSCGRSEFLSQIETTLRQFPTVARVVLAINHQPHLFYEWLELECDDTNDYCGKSLF